MSSVYLSLRELQNPSDRMLPSLSQATAPTDMDPSKVDIPPMKDLTIDNITENVHTINSRCPDPRVKYLFERLVTHLHDFARETRLSTSEWMAAIEFLTKVGQICSDVRQVAYPSIPSQSTITFSIDWNTYRNSSFSPMFSVCHSSWTLSITPNHHIPPKALSSARSTPMMPKTFQTAAASPMIQMESLCWSSVRSKTRVEILSKGQR